ncbi:MAG: aminodeoxychorismate/anthranilate synthase component II [bacterium]
MKVLVIDNYDSFTYNLVQYIGEVDESPDVVRSDEKSVEEIAGEDYEAIVISPGPGTPEDAGVSMDVIRNLGEETPILGVCLGHQCIASVYGGTVKQADELLHGKTSGVFHSESPLYEELDNPFTATRYHSLIVGNENLPDELSIDALSEQGEIMGFHHREHPVLGVQYHPESILTEQGRTLIRNFLDYAQSGG